jgi:hypothetical protein
VEVLAEAAVRRGYLNREWLRGFLHAARYPAPERLLDELCPTGPNRPRPARIYQNLPAPTYSQFVMRAQPFAEVLDGLQQRSALVLIASLGGMGKTSLAREVAARCLHADGDAPLFDAAVWVSDKDRPGTTTLSIVLDEIARTLDYPGFTQFAHDEKRREVEQLLRRQKVLLIVDNFETITDGALLTWLLRLPEPSKAIVTSREYSRAFRNSTIVVDLRGMSEAEAQEFIGQRLRFLKIEKLVGARAQLDPLVAATGGNPKALEVALGLIKHERRPLQYVVDDLYAARGELFDDLFARAWALLDEAARRVLMSATFFPDSASGEALAVTADVQGFAFDHSVERLLDLALLDEQRADLATAPRYMLHPLVRAFAGARFGEQPGFEAEARGRWLRWYIQLVSSMSFFYYDLNTLRVLDPEQETIYSLVKWSLDNYCYSEILQITKVFSYYYHVRGLWDKKIALNLMSAEAANKLGDLSGEILALSYAVHGLSLQGNVSDADRYLSRSWDLVRSSQPTEESLLEFQKANALYCMAAGDIDMAQQFCQESLDFISRLTPSPYINKMLANNYGWMAHCLYQKGLLTQSQEFQLRSLQKATESGYQRNIIFTQLRLAAIDLDQGNPESAAERLALSSEQAYQYKDRECLAHLQYVSARLHTLRGDLPAARAALAEAIDLFERLGMRRELAEARAELARLDR